MVKTKIINYKVIILCFPNSSLLKNYLDDEHIFYNYLVSFNYLHSYDDKVQIYNKTCAQFVIDFIKNSVNNYDIKKLFEITKKQLIDNIKDTKIKSYYGKNLILSIKSIKNTNIKYHNEITLKKIFTYYPIPELDIIDNNNQDSNYYSSKVYELIREINLLNKKIFYCDKLDKNFNLKISFEAMKFYHRHKTYYELYCIDIKKGDKKILKALIRRLYKTFIEDDEVNNKENECDENNENMIQQKNCFITIYNCNIYDLFDMNIYSFLKCNSSFIIIYDNNNLYDSKELQTTKRELKEKELKINYFSNRNTNDKINDIFIDSNIIKEKREKNII